MAENRGDEFWLFFSIYIKSLKQSSHHPSSLGQSVISMLERLRFFTDCQNLAAMKSIVQQLQVLGVQLPFESRKTVASSLFQRALVSDSVETAKECIDFAKQIVDFSFSAILDSVQQASSIVRNREQLDADQFDYMMSVIEEEICWYILEEPRLVEYALEEKQDILEDHNLIRLYENSRLANILHKGLQSKASKVRLQALKVATACSFHSKIAFLKLLPIFEAALCLEDFELREYAVASLMDIIYMHHHCLNFEDVSHFLLHSLYAPTMKMQFAAVIGCGRLLLFDCFEDQTECLLSAMIERYVYAPPKNIPIKENFDSVVQALHMFFQKYSGNKQQHQDQIANTLVYLILEKIEQGVLVVDQVNSMIIKNMRKNEEVRCLQLAIKFGSSLADDILDSIMDGLAMNEITISKEKCLSWLF